MTLIATLQTRIQQNPQTPVADQEGFRGITFSAPPPPAFKQPMKMK